MNAISNTLTLGIRLWNGHICSKSTETVIHNLLDHSSIALISLFAVAERPQHMLMRVAVGMHGRHIDDAIEVCERSCICVHKSDR